MIKKIKGTYENDIRRAKISVVAALAERIGINHALVVTCPST